MIKKTNLYNQNDETLANVLGNCFINMIRNTIYKISKIVETEKINSINDQTLFEPQTLFFCEFDFLKQNHVKTLIV